MRHSGFDFRDRVLFKALEGQEHGATTLYKPSATVAVVVQLSSGAGNASTGNETECVRRRPD